jgi:predicted DNA-binding transcriptional regulator AlpA
MRTFSQITLMQIIREVQEEGVPKFSRSQFYRWAKRDNWPMPPRTGGHWRAFGNDFIDPNHEIANYYKILIKKANGFDVVVPKIPEILKHYNPST